MNELPSNKKNKQLRILMMFTDSSPSILALIASIPLGNEIHFESKSQDWNYNIISVDVRFASRRILFSSLLLLS